MENWLRILPGTAPLAISGTSGSVRSNLWIVLLLLVSIPPICSSPLHHQLSATT